MVAFAIVIALFVVVHGWPGETLPEPAALRRMTADELRALATSQEDDMRLLAHFRRRIEPGSAGGSLPPAARVAYATLRIEELSRTEGWPLGLAATPSPDGEVAPGDAAAAYGTLGRPDAAAVMRLLQPLVVDERARWQAYRAAGTGGAPPAGRGFGELAHRLEALLPAIRAARREWIVAHADELAGP